MSKKQSHYIQLDLILLFLGLTIFSLLAIYSAQQLGQYSRNFVFQQGVFIGISLCVFAVIQFFDLEQMRKLSLPIYVLGVLSLIVLKLAPTTIAEPKNNAKSWFTLPGFSIQPAEFVKIALILFLAAIIMHHQKKYTQATVLSELWLIAKIVIITIIPVIFIIEQPDLGTSLICFFIAGIMIILSGINWKVLGTVILSGAAFSAVSLYLVVTLPEMAEKYLKIKPYQIDRIMTWFDPTQQTKDDRYHIDLSLQTVGPGKITGIGLNPPQVILPEAHTDFVFSVVASSFGFIGASILIFIFFLLIYKLLTLGMKVHPLNPFGAYFCFGFMGLILIHTFQNIGMTISIMPITGVPLLFVSYGGSSILSTMIGYAIVYRIAIEHSKQQDYLFN